MDWNRDACLSYERAETRDGRIVVDLHEAVLDGRDVLIGKITRLTARQIKSLLKNKTSRICDLELHVWESGGLGCHGGDDLVNGAHVNRMISELGWPIK